METERRALGEAARWAWAKSSPNPSFEQPIERWLPLHQHLADTAAVAGRLWDGWLHPRIRSIVVEAVGDADTARALAVWLAGLHDCGKLSPAFSIQVKPLADAMSERGLRMDSALAGSEERRLARHEAVSAIVVADWLAVRHGFDERRARRLGSVLAAHHGNPPSSAHLRRIAHQERLLGDAAWQRARIELIEALSAETVTAEQLGVIARAELSQPVLVLLSALVILADWIASNEELFPLVPLGQQPDETAAVRAERALRRLRLPEPWRAAVPEDDTEVFRSRFGIETSYPAQTALLQLARQSTEPSLFIVESSMGSGKTEAAFAAAEALATVLGMGGVFVGLPTQATTDAMFARLLRWSRRLGLETPLSVFLGHGKSGLNEAYDRMQQAARFSGIGDYAGAARPGRTEDEAVVAHHWLADAKRGPLAHLVVGTIDQSLMLALRGKHVMLRHLALAGKVVVLDEIHAFDAYTGQYIERLLHWLGAYGAPVILLSATLPASTRRALAAAYLDGRRTALPVTASSSTAQPGSPLPTNAELTTAQLTTAQPAEAPRAARQRGPAAMHPAASAPAAAPDPLDALDGDIGYPSIVAVSEPGAAPVILRPASEPRSQTVRLERGDDDLDSLTVLLGEALAEGGVAVVIRNTVGRVQETAEHLRAHLGGTPVIVAHSRFLAKDRAEKDSHLIRLFGKGGRRPERMVLVASQVVEQSLDIDFDLMVSDLAPIDLLLQRAGRLHRHRNEHRPARLENPRLVIVGADWGQSPPEPLRASSTIYGEHLLLRTLAVLHQRDGLVLPADIPTLVQRVYGPGEVGPGEWRPELRRAAETFAIEQRRKRAEADVFRLHEVEAEGSLLGWVDAGAGDPANDRHAAGSVRDGADSIEVLVLRLDEDGITLRTVDWTPDGGQQVPNNERPSWALTREILASSLRLPFVMSVGRQGDAIIRELEDRTLELDWHSSPALRGELVLLLDHEYRAELGGFALHYDRDEGLRAERIRRERPFESERSA